MMMATKIYEVAKDNGQQAARLICSTILKMLEGKEGRYNDPFSSLQGRSLLVYSDRGWAWETMSAVVRSNPFKTPNKNTSKYYFIDVVGSGVHGSCWIACSKGGATCVLKQNKINTPAKENVLSEYQTYLQVYHQIPLTKYIRTLRLNEIDFLLMPYFFPIALEDREKYKKEIKETLGLFASQKCKHSDVKWDNIGTWKHNNQVYVILFDLARTEQSEDSSWVDDALNMLN
eukprot:c19943_g1_i2.p1 GENE.c19943_g1_i2~~c19943_g1_i2.p1  ORF type:complete len:231 (+),score=39.66 c19943_g1_i2:370-1062(+)